MTPPHAFAAGASRAGALPRDLMATPAQFGSPAVPQTASMLTQALNRHGSQDALALATLVREAVAAGAERQALHLRMSGLVDRVTAEHHHRLVREALAPLLRPTRSRLFELPNGDVVAVVPARSGQIDAVRAALDTLLHAEGEAPNHACTMLRLPQQAAALLTVVEDSLDSGRTEPAVAFGGQDFSGAALAALEKALGSTSLAAYMRQRPVCRLRPGGGQGGSNDGPEPEWYEYRVAMQDLCATLMPGADPTSAPWLHRRLKRLVDRRLLAELARPEEVRQLGRIGLSLTVQGLTDPEFLRLDSLLGQEARRKVVLGLSVTEVLGDPEGFAFAASFCRARGYRLALEKVAAATLLLLPRGGAIGDAAGEDLGAQLGMDLLKLRWSPALTQLGPRLAEVLPRRPDSIVLTGVDRAAAIGWGWEHGITLFQGTLVGVRGR